MSFLLVGLGNPGSKYELTRHNAGFLAVDALIDHFDFKKKGKKFQSILYEGRIGDQNVTIMKPQTYMNDSGTAVQLFLSFFKIPVSDLIVFYDDFDIDLGKIKLRLKGSGGTHNGMKDIIQKLKTNEIKRFRIGIGPKSTELSTHNFVLSAFQNQEIPILEKALDTCNNAISSSIENFDKAMNLYNR